MRIAIEGDGYDTAADALIDANQALGLAYQLFTSELGGHGAMAGTDGAGSEFAAAFDPAAAAAVTAYADLVAALGNLGGMTRATVANHRRANRASVMTAGVTMYEAGDDLDPGEAITVWDYPPPSVLGGDGWGPDWWHWVADHVGYLYPDADTDRLRAAAGVWRAEGARIGRLATACTIASAQLGRRSSPEVPVAGRAIGILKTEMDSLAGVFDDLGQACEDFAEHVDTARRSLEEAVAEFIAESIAIQAVSAGLAAFTVGASEVVGQALQGTKPALVVARVVKILAALKEAISLRVAAFVLVRTRWIEQSLPVLARFKNAETTLFRAMRGSKWVPRNPAALVRFEQRLARARLKLPVNWDRGLANVKGIGRRWHSGNCGVRIDLGDPLSKMAFAAGRPCHRTSRRKSHRLRRRANCREHLAESGGAHPAG